MTPRVIGWYSSGAASAVACKLTLAKHDRAVVHLVRCDTGSEDEDNDRFADECVRWFNHPVESIRSDKYADTWEVWEETGWLAGIEGARCTGAMKIEPRLAFQRPTDIHVFGYTADRSDVERAKRLRDNYPELRIETPLIEAGLTKAACLAMIMNAAIQPPRVYAMGFPNANCIPCVKATSPAYWALVRQRFPEKFERMAKLSRDLDVRLCRIKDERRFIDEIPYDWPTTNPIAPACDFLCHIAEQDIAA